MYLIVLGSKKSEVQSFVELQIGAHMVHPTGDRVLEPSVRREEKR